MRLDLARQEVTISTVAQTLFKLCQIYNIKLLQANVGSCERRSAFVA